MRSISIIILLCFAGVLLTEASIGEAKPMTEESPFSSLENTQKEDLNAFDEDEANWGKRRHHDRDFYESKKDNKTATWRKEHRHGLRREGREGRKGRSECHRKKPTPPPQKPLTPSKSHSHSGCKRHSPFIQRLINFFRRSVLARILLAALCIGLVILGVWIFVKVYNRWLSKKQKAFYSHLEQLKIEETSNPEVASDAFIGVREEPKIAEVDDFQVINNDNDSNLSPLPEEYCYNKMH